MFSCSESEWDNVGMRHLNGGETVFVTSGIRSPSRSILCPRPHDMGCDVISVLIELFIYRAQIQDGSNMTGTICV
jgi:hypothetical protein